MKILAFFPHNFYAMSAGCHRRIYDLLGYFRARSHDVDLLTLSGFTNTWGRKDLARRDLVRSITACKWQTQPPTNGLPNFVSESLRRAFSELASRSDYDCYLISYAYWADLIACGKPAVSKVIDLHDFLTLNHHSERGTAFSHDEMFADEIRAISKFDCALSISEEETVALSPFCAKTRFVDVPMFFPARFVEGEQEILFVGSDNVFNRRGMTWFTQSVRPLLPAHIKITVVGAIADRVADDLAPYYRKSRVVICPMLGGTGLKVKVVEALSYGRPVVTTTAGLAGMLQKRENGCIVADTADAFAAAIVRLFSDDAHYRAMRRQAEAYFLSRFTTEQVYQALDSVFSVSTPAASS